MGSMIENTRMGREFIRAGPNRRLAGYGATSPSLGSRRRKGAPPMVSLFWVRWLAVVTVFLSGSASRADDQPKLLPTRDVDIRYDVTRPQQPKVRERVRWLAAEHLERVDASGRSTSIFDHDLLTPVTRTFRKLDQAPRRPLEPEAGTALQRGAEAMVAGLSCTDWSWMEDGEKHIVCATADGVILRLVVDGQTFIEARSVNYGPQKPDLVRVPANYTPARFRRSRRALIL